MTKIKSRNILVVGGDLTSNGGIASVIKSLYSAYEVGNYDYDLFLLKTGYYKDKGLFFELIIFITPWFKAFYHLVFNNVGLMHIHSSARVSFYRKSFFIILGIVLRKKIIIHLHSSDFYNFFLTDNRIIKRVISYCDCVIVLCSDWESKLSAKFPNTYIKKIENPYESNITIGSFKKFSNEAFKVLSVGFFIESKGIKDIIKLAEHIKANSPGKIIIQLAGKGELEEFIINSIKEKNLGDIIQVIGWVSKDKKEQVFKESNALILPSYKEGMPISILEAMSYGLPIISTNISGIPDIVINEENGFLYNPGNIEGFYQGIDKLVNDNLLCEKMYNNNIERVKKNHKVIIFHQINEEYKKLLNI